MKAGPYSEAVQQAVAAAYDAFGRGQVGAGLEVCHCPVCMTEETRARIIATSNDALGVDLILEYSNSAHGVPRNLDDLRLLLPRYLDVMAQDELVDSLGVGTEMLRFGQAAEAHPKLFSSSERNVLDDWARAMIWQVSWANVQEDDAVQSPASLFETLLCGGWPVAVLTAALEAVFDDTRIGRPSLQAFAEAVMQRQIKRGQGIAPDWFAMRYCSRKVRAEVAAWLNLLAASDQVLDLASDPGGADTWNMLQDFAWSAGQFDPELFPHAD